MPQPPSLSDTPQPTSFKTAAGLTRLAPTSRSSPGQASLERSLLTDPIQPPPRHDDEDGSDIKADTNFEKETEPVIVPSDVTAPAVLDDKVNRKTVPIPIKVHTRKRIIEDGRRTNKLAAIKSSSGCPTGPAAASSSVTNAPPPPPGEYRLVDGWTDPTMMQLFVAPRAWLPYAPADTIERQIAEIVARQDDAVHITDESLLATTKFELHKDKKLFGKKRNSFFLGRYRRRPVLVKRVTVKPPPPPAQPSQESGSGGGVGSDTKLVRKSVDYRPPHWVVIAKRIAHAQQIELTKMKTSAVLPDQTSTSTSANVVRLVSTTSTTQALSTGVSTTAASAASPKTTPWQASSLAFVHILELFYLETDRAYLIFMEVAPHKSLHFHVKHRTPTHVQQARLWSAQTLDGLTWLGNHGIAHRCIRLEHLVLDGGHNVRILGWRRAIPLGGVVTHRERRIRGNNHLPPEAFRGYYDPASVDVWSWGVALCALTTFRYPFNVKRSGSILPFVSVEQEWSSFKTRHAASCHSQVMAILDALFITEADRRATVKTIQRADFYAQAPIKNAQPPPPTSSTDRSYSISNS